MNVSLRGPEWDQAFETQALHVRRGFVWDVGNAILYFRATKEAVSGRKTVRSASFWGTFVLRLPAAVMIR